MKLHDIPQIGGQMYLRDETDLWGFIQNGKYEPEETEIIKKLVKAQDVCLDIGANIGYFTVLLAKKCKEVWAFEPEPSNFNMLMMNLMMNDISNVYTVKSAVSWECGTNKLYLCDKSHGMHRMYKSVHCKDSIDVKTVSIDSTGLRPNFIKVDAEGFEWNVLLGMCHTLDKYHPIVVMEFHPPSIEEAGHKHHPQAIYDQLKVLGYDIYLMPYIENTISFNKLYERTDNVSGGQSILCLPK